MRKVLASIDPASVNSLFPKQKSSRDINKENGKNVIRKFKAFFFSNGSGWDTFGIKILGIDNPYQHGISRLEAIDEAMHTYNLPTPKMLLPKKSQKKKLDSKDLKSKIKPTEPTFSLEEKKFKQSAQSASSASQNPKETLPNQTSKSTDNNWLGTSFFPIHKESPVPLLTSNKRCREDLEMNHPPEKKTKPTNSDFSDLMILADTSLLESYLFCLASAASQNVPLANLNPTEGTHTKRSHGQTSYHSVPQTDFFMSPTQKDSSQKPIAKNKQKKENAYLTKAIPAIILK